MDQTETSEVASLNQRVFKVVSTFLISLMITCIAITVTLFGQKLLNGWQAAYLPFLCFLVSLERLATFRRTRRMLVFSKSWWIYYFSQWVVILLVLKLVVLVVNRPESIWMEIQLWRLDFLTYFFDMDYVIAVVFIIAIWVLSGYLAGLLDEMGLEEALIRYEMAVEAPLEGPPARERLLGIILGLGFIMVILTALMRVNMRMLFLADFDELGIQPLPYLAAGAWNVLLYFLLGLVLMSLSQFARLNARWRFQKIEITRQVASRWVVYSLIFILLLALVASLLPTNYSLGLLSAVAYGLQWLFGVLIFVFGFLWTLLLFLLSQLALLFRIHIQGEEPLPAQTFTPPDIPPELVPSGAYPWLDVIKSILFWVVFLGVISFSVVQFARQHGDILNSMRRFPALSWLAGFWRWLSDGFRGFNRRISGVVEEGLQRLRTRRELRVARSVVQYINLRRLTPRQRVYFFFFAMLRRGEERGLPRKDAQTPHEYAATLEDVIPEVDEDLASLTDSFIEARYTRKDIDEVQATLVRRYWERIRGALRSHRK
jgi:hypothetical protein